MTLGASITLVWPWSVLHPEALEQHSPENAQVKSFMDLLKKDNLHGRVRRSLLAFGNIPETSWSHVEVCEEVSPT